MADPTVRQLTAELTRDPQSLVFLQLGEILRASGALDAAQRVAVAGLERHPGLPEAHDLCARVLADRGDLEGAERVWHGVLTLDPRHGGAHKGLGFLAYRRGDLDGALDHLELALSADPTDQGVIQALLSLRASAALPMQPPAPLRPAVFDGLEGAEHGLVLLDGQGRVLGGGIRRDGIDVAEEVAAHLAAVAQEAERTTRLLDLGPWGAVVAEADHGNFHLTQPSPGTLLLLARDLSIPSGRLAVLADRAAHAARRWLAEQAP